MTGRKVSRLDRNPQNTVIEVFYDNPALPLTAKTILNMSYQNRWGLTRSQVDNTLSRLHRAGIIKKYVSDKKTVGWYGLNSPVNQYKDLLMDIMKGRASLNQLVKDRRSGVKRVFISRGSGTKVYQTSRVSCPISAMPRGDDNKELHWYKEKELNNTVFKWARFEFVWKVGDIGLEFNIQIKVKVSQGTRNANLTFWFPHLDFEVCGVNDNAKNDQLVEDLKRGIINCLVMRYGYRFGDSKLSCEYAQPVPELKEVIKGAKTPIKNLEGGWIDKTPPMLDEDGNVIPQYETTEKAVRDKFTKLRTDTPKAIADVKRDISDVKRDTLSRKDYSSWEHWKIDNEGTYQAEVRSSLRTLEQGGRNAEQRDTQAHTNQAEIVRLLSEKNHGLDDLRYMTDTSAGDDDYDKSKEVKECKKPKK